MKKLLVVVLTLLMLVGIPAGSFAEPSAKDAGVSLISSAATVKPGETVTLTAVTLKQGSAYTDEWIGATKITTVLTEDGYYVSTAEISPEVTVTVQYKITMTAGNCGTSFIGQAETVISATKPAEVVGIEVKNIRPEPEIPGFYKGDVYVVFSDGNLNEYGVVYFGLREGQITKVFYVSVNGTRYTYTLNLASEKL